MSRIRTIKPDFWASEQIMECSPLARLVFIGMWNFCDDNGVHPASCKTLKAQVFPGDDMTAAEVQALMGELIAQGLVMEFSAGNRAWWFVTGWHHQFINRASPSRYPRPPRDSDNSLRTQGALSEDSVRTQGALSEDSVRTQGALSEDSVRTHGALSEDSVQEGKGRDGSTEGKGREGMGEEERGGEKNHTQPKLKASRLSLEDLPQAWQVWAEKERPDLDPHRTFDAFRDYWANKQGAEGTKLDWSATWRNWVRREHAQPKTPKQRSGNTVSELSRQGQQQVSNIEAWLDTARTTEREVIDSECV